MAWYTGLPEAAYSGFMTPYLADQKQGKEDERQRRQGMLIKDAMLKMLPQKQNEILGVDPSVMSQMADPIFNQAGREAGFAREDAVTKGNREYAEGQQAKETQQENEGYRVVMNAVSPGMGDRYLNNPNAKITPDGFSTIMRNHNDQISLQKVNTDIKNMYHDAPIFQDTRIAADWVNNKQGISRDATNFQQSKDLVDYRGSVNSQNESATTADPQDVQDIIALGMKLLEEDDTGASLKEALGRGGDIDEQLLDLGDEKAYTEARNILNRAMRKKRLTPIAEKPPRVSDFKPQFVPGALGGSLMPVRK